MSQIPTLIITSISAIRMCSFLVGYAPSKNTLPLKFSMALPVADVVGHTLSSKSSCAVSNTGQTNASQVPGAQMNLNVVVHVASRNRARLARANVVWSGTKYI